MAESPPPGSDGEPYREWAAALPGAVLWTRVVPTRGTLPSAGSRVLPDGCLDLIRTSSGILVAGPDSTAHVTPDEPGRAFVGLRLPPGVGPAVLGVPAHELKDRRVPLADVWGDRAAGRLGRRLEQAPPEETATLLDALARQRLAAVRDGGRRGMLRPDPALDRLVELLRAGSRVADAAAAIGVADRQLHRRCLVAFGYGAKTLARILRLHRALELARTGAAPALVAAVTGYADQPHLAREVKALAGVPLGELVRPAEGP